MGKLLALRPRPGLGRARPSAPLSATGCRRTCRSCSSRRSSRTTASSSATTRPAAAGAATAERDARAAATTGWSPARTRPPGQPLLANDPHLGLGVPSIWTAVHLTAPGLDVAGVTLPGAPGVILGPQPRRGLGLHQRPRRQRRPLRRGVRPARPGPLPRRRRLGARRPCARSRSACATARSPRPARTVDAPRARHAPRPARRDPRPPLRAALDGARATRVELHRVRPRWTARANWDEFQDALATVPRARRRTSSTPTSTATSPGTRRAACPSAASGDGSRPVPRRAPRTATGSGFVPFDELPHVVDPPSGRIVTANNRLVGTDYPYASRAAASRPGARPRSSTALEAREGWTADDMARLQGERLSIPHRDLARALLRGRGAPPGDAAWDDGRARPRRGWDGRLEPSSRAAALRRGRLPRARRARDRPARRRPADRGPRSPAGSPPCSASCASGPRRGASRGRRRLGRTFLAAWQRRRAAD